MDFFSYSTQLAASVTFLNRFVFIFSRPIPSIQGEKNRFEIGTMNSEWAKP